MSEELCTKFNMNRLLNFGNKENYLTFGAYNGNIRMSFGPTEFVKGKAPRYILLNPSVRYLLHSLVSWVIANAAPGIKKSITIKGLWNEEARKRELSAVITVGMDDKAMCYIGIKHINTERESYTCKFELTGDRSVEIAGEYDDDASRSMNTLKMLEQELKTSLLVVGALLTRNHLVARNFSNNKSNSTPKSSSSDDIDF